MQPYNYIVILVGVCGTGKSIVGQRVAHNLKAPFFDADKLFISKELGAGKLPQDENLEEWLKSLEELILEQSTKKGCVISCSVLKREHRKRLTAIIEYPLDWVFMKGSYEDVVQRIESEVHERPVSFLKSDFETLETPKRALTIDMSYSEEQMVDTILKYIARKYW
ncbi:shikimate kinase [Allomuricauda sp. d1]|uniref:shikimate kinase n=1 Tax=Allomuricauda sp. d1 TaxID=3136725 RepID=UPI0031E0E6FD